RLAADLAQHVRRESRPLALRDGDTALKVRQPEGGDAVAAVRGAKQREQRLVLGDRHDLPVAERPPLRGEGEREDRNLSEEWISHRRVLSVSALRPLREDTLQRDTVVQREIRLDVVVRLATAGP